MLLTDWSISFPSPSPVENKALFRAVWPHLFRWRDSGCAIDSGLCAGLLDSCSPAYGLFNAKKSERHERLSRQFIFLNVFSQSLLHFFPYLRTGLSVTCHALRMRRDKLSIALYSFLSDGGVILVSEGLMWIKMLSVSVSLLTVLVSFNMFELNA